MANPNDAIREAKHLEAALPEIWRTDATHRHGIEGQDAANALANEYLTWLQQHPGQGGAVEAQLQRDHAPIVVTDKHIEFDHGKEDITSFFAPNNKYIESSGWQKEKPKQFWIF